MQSPAIAAQKTRVKYLARREKFLSELVDEPELTGNVLDFKS